jgi:ParB family chromosome partitioning protein
MVKKRSVFDIDFDPEDEGDTASLPPPDQRAPETKAYNVQGHPLQNTGAVPSTRRGPMASAISEAAAATAQRAGAEAAIRAENDALAHEHVRLKKLGLITDLVATKDVFMAKLTRDRSANTDPDLDELIESIKAVGLSNPIRVEQTSNGFELIQGYRRLAAFRALAEQTGDPLYDRIPAAMVPRGEPLQALYRKMVDENLVRKDLSFGEMAQLALSYARDEGIDVSAAVSVLYASALKQKRTYIRQFARILEVLNGAVRYPEAIPRALGLDLSKALDATPGRGERVIAALAAHPQRNIAEELRILRSSITAPRDKPASQTAFTFDGPHGDARVTASDGKLEVRLARNFAAISEARLQQGIEAMLAALGGDD